MEPTKLESQLEGMLGVLEAAASQRARADFYLETQMAIVNELKPLFGLDAVRADHRGLVLLVRYAVTLARDPWWRRIFRRRFREGDPVRGER